MGTQPLQRALAVHRRFTTINGAALSAYVALTAFVAVFPIALLLIAALGFVSSASADLPQRVVDSLGLSGDAAHLVTNAFATAERSRRSATVAGTVGFVITATALGGALAMAFNAAWGVPNRRLVPGRVRRLLWLAGTFVLVVAAFAATTAISVLPWYLAPPGIVVGIILNSVLWLWASASLPNRDIERRLLLPTAILAGIAFEALKVAGALVVPRLVASSSELYGTLGVVFAMLVWLLVFGRIAVYVSVLEAMRWEERGGYVC